MDDAGSDVEPRYTCENADCGERTHASPSHPHVSVRVHGTYAGYQAHRRAQEAACEPCRAANSAYQAQVRATHPRRALEDAQTAAAYRRALARLRKRHHAEFLRLVAEERNQGA